MTSDRRLVLSAFIAFGLVLGMGSAAWGQVDAELLRKAKAGHAVAQSPNLYSQFNCYCDLRQIVNSTRARPFPRGTHP